jgi:hypothetical protein
MAPPATRFTGVDRPNSSHTKTTHRVSRPPMAQKISAMPGLRVFCSTLADDTKMPAPIVRLTIKRATVDQWIFCLSGGR